MNLRYFHVFLGYKIGAPKTEKLSGGELKTPCDLEK